LRLDAIAFASNPDNQKVEIGRIAVQGQPAQKVSKPHISTKSHEWWYTPVIPATGERYS
jgi:hypothetical protein